MISIFRFKHVHVSCSNIVLFMSLVSSVTNDRWRCLSFFVDVILLFVY